MDEVSRVLGELYRLLEAELQQTAQYSLIQGYDAVIARYPKQTHFIAATKDLQNKLRSQLRDLPLVKMMQTVETLIEQRDAMMQEEEVDLMSGVTVTDHQMERAIGRWENEGGAVQ